LLWIVLPYAAVVLLIGGLIARYRADQFGWTSRSSQIYESKILRLGSPLFHGGLLLVVGGHVVGLLIPEAWTSKIGISEHTYHWIAVALGSVSGVLTLAGLAILLFRRITVGAVAKATTHNDVFTFTALIFVLCAGALTTIIGGIAGGGGGLNNYRATVAPYLRSLFYLHPHLDQIQAAPTEFKVHVALAFCLFAILPFTRLVHLVSAPVGYLLRPYIVYRSRRTTRAGNRPVRRGWAPVVGLHK